MIEDMPDASLWRISARRTEKFFKSLHRFGILLVGPRPGAHMREAQVLQGTIDGVVRHRDPELLMQPHDQVAPAPAHHTMDRRDRALMDDPGEKGLVAVIELGGSNGAPLGISDELRSTQLTKSRRRRIFPEEFLGNVGICVVGKSRKGENETPQASDLLSNFGTRGTTRVPLHRP
jgi:hypothetical protein